MALFDALIGDIAERFGLGANASPFLREILNLVARSPQGLNGFLKKLTSVGLGPDVESWLGRPDAPALPNQLVERALGSSALRSNARGSNQGSNTLDFDKLGAETLGAIAGKFGLPSSIVTSAAGYVLPKIIGLLTPGGSIPTVLPAAVTNFLTAGGNPQPAASGEAAARGPVSPGPVSPGSEAKRAPQWLRWFWPAAAALCLLALISFLANQRPDHNVSNVAQAPTPVPPPKPAPAPAIEAQPAQFSLNNDAGVIHYSGTVHDELTRASIVAALQSVFGADKVSGDIGVDANRDAAPWLANLRSALENFKYPGLAAMFSGNSINLGGVGDADRDKILNSLKGLYGAGWSFASSGDKAASDRAGEVTPPANAQVTDALTSLKPGFSAKDLVDVLNLSVINFPNAGYDLPSPTLALMQQASAVIKQLGRDTVIEIAGYTDNTGDAAANLALSQQRADAVRNALVANGVDPAMLVAKGYGNANAVGGNDTEEGRARNRRIEYHIIKS